MALMEHTRNIEEMPKTESDGQQKLKL